MSYVIEACLKARSVDRTIVSTDHEQIAEVAREWGAEVPFMRPAAFAGDLVTLDPVITTRCSRSRRRRGGRLTSCLPCSPPARCSPETIDRSVRTLIDGGQTR